MRHAGVHFPNGPEKWGLLSSLPGTAWTMTSPEARYHYDRMRKIGKTVLWRDVPAPGNRPAEIGWNARRAADAAMVLWKEQPHSGVEHFQSHCELTLNYERGDSEDDFADLDGRHRKIAVFLADLEPELRQRLPKGTLLHFPPFVPDGRSYDRLDLWRGVADRYDVINIHQYGPPEGILQQVQWHLDTWPSKGCWLSEWHNDEPERTLELLADLAAREPRFLGATWFIAHWYDAPGDWPAWKNLQDNEDLYRIFLHPPTVQPVPIPAPEPTVPDYRAMTRAAAATAGIDQDLFERQIGQECGWSPDVIECRRDSSAGARGIAQIVPRFHPGVDPCDPQAALTYAANLMASNVKTYGSYQKALIAYNWGPGNLSHWNGDPNALPTETRHYLDVILGAGWPEPGGAPVAGIKLSEVLDRARSREGDPYVWGGHAPGGLDCSGLVSLAYGGKLPAFTDAIFDATERVETPAPGDVILYEYSDTNQPGVRFPHTELFLSDTRCYGSRYPMGVGEHDQLPRTQARRYYRRAPNVIVDTVGAPAPAPTPDFSVGGGILAAMQAHGDQPASDEVYVKHGDKDAWSEALGASGSLYRWVPAVGRVFRYDPAA